MRLVLATNLVHLPEGFGGSPQSTHDLAVALAAAGQNVVVFAALRPHGYLGYRIRLLQRLQKIYGGRRILVDRGVGYPVYRCWDPSNIVPQFVGQFRPDVAVIQAGLPLKLANRFVGQRIPTIVYIRDTEFDELGETLAPDPLLRFVANSAFTAAAAKAKLGIESTVIPPLVRPERFATKTTREKLVFINPVAQKGVEVALQLAQNRSDIPFLFVEAWPIAEVERAAMLARVSRLPNVIWMPIQRDMRTIYGQARALLVPSQWNEAWGRVVSEAQVSGIPVLASRRGGLPESVGPGGILVEAEAPIGDWERALSRLWDDRQTYESLSRLALLHAHRDTFQPRAITDQFMVVIREHVKSNVATSSERSIAEA